MTILKLLPKDTLVCGVHFGSGLTIVSICKDRTVQGRDDNSIVIIGVSVKDVTHIHVPIDVGIL